MEEQTFELTDILKMQLFLGSLTYLSGLVYQLWTTYRQDKKFKFKSLTLVVLTRLLTFTSTSFVWVNWIHGVDIRFGFILLPALIPELLFSPLLLKIFGYSLWRTDKIASATSDDNTTEKKHSS